MAKTKKSRVTSLEEMDPSLAYTEDGEFDPGAYLHNLYEAGLSASAQKTALFADERLDISRAANFMEFCQSSSYLNFPAFPRMLQIASHLLGEICYFCSHPDFIYQMFDQDTNTIMDNVVFTRYGKCPKCNRTRFDFIKYDKWMFPEALIAILGQRSGKNYLLAQLASYQLHRFLTLERDGKRVSPHEYMHLGPGMLTMTFTAATLGQAMRNIWNVFQPTLLNGPWFQEYFKYLDHHGKKMGEELYSNNSTYLRFRNKLIDVSCAAPNQTTLRGPTRIGFGIDEISHHDINTERTAKKKESSVLGSADDIWTSLNNSLKTVRNAAKTLIMAGDYDVPTAYDWSISSPCHANDIGMRRLRMSETPRNRIFGAHYATWEVNPEYKNGKADFAGEYAVSESEADRNFAALPPLTVSPWIQDPQPVLLAVRAKQDKPVVTYDYRQEKSLFGNLTAWYELNQVQDSGKPRILSIDNGYSNNAFALTLSSLDAKGNPYIDQCVMLKPTETHAINLARMWDNFIYPIICKCNIVLILYDRWNSLQNVQALENEGKNAKQYSLTPKDFLMFRQKLLNGEVSYPFSEYSPNVFLGNQSSDVDLVGVSQTRPGFALLLQTLTVRLLGGRLAKPLYGDDDVFRTAMLGLRFLYDPETIPKLSGPGTCSTAFARTGTAGLVSVRMRSGPVQAPTTQQSTPRTNAAGKPRGLVSVVSRTRSGGLR